MLLPNAHHLLLRSLLFSVSKQFWLLGQRPCFCAIEHDGGDDQIWNAAFQLNCTWWSDKETLVFPVGVQSYLNAAYDFVVVNGREKKPAFYDR